LKELQWPEGTIASQKQWIGRSEGTLIKFGIDDFSSSDGKQHQIEVFTTRADTLMGVTYLVLAPEHPLVNQITSPAQQTAVSEYQKSISGRSDIDRVANKVKTGVPLGVSAIHPITKEKIPIWTADYVLASYGTGAVMAVPAHDERDFQFAEAFQLPIKQVIVPEEQQQEQSKELSDQKQQKELPYTGEGKLINSGETFNGLPSTTAAASIADWLVKEKKGETRTMNKLRDWNFSRQRYWGEPIPIYFPVDILPNDGGLTNPLEGAPHNIRYDQPIPLEESELPLKLPEMTDFHPKEDPHGCLARAKEWRYFQKEDGKWYARETNTMPQWAGSCWYYLRFIDPSNNQEIFSKQAAKDWLPVDLYVGGQEHAVLHLLYARFWHKFLFDIDLVDHKEPFMKLVHQGMILGPDGEKMSKSRGNVINPDDIIHDYGADALRLYEMFMGPIEAVKPWQTEQVLGVVRFRDRVYNLFHKKIVEDVDMNEPKNHKLRNEMHKTIKKVTEDIEKMCFNTAISALMVYSNSITAYAKENQDTIPKTAIEILLLLLSPIAPHIAEECWSLLGHQKSISKESWPSYQDEYCQSTTTAVSVSINGKFSKVVLEVPTDTEEQTVIDLVMKHPKVISALKGKNVTKQIYVPGKIMNLIVPK
jgi:leucyl-tRNA synthetase